MLQFSDHPEYLHVLLSHLPVVGLGLALVVLFIGLIKEDRSLALTGLVLQGTVSVTTFFVIETGKSALEHVKVDLDVQSAALLEAHATMGETWGVLYYLTAVFSLVAAGVAWKWPKRLWWPSAIAAVFAMISLVVGFYTAHSGGKVRHPEFRTAPGSKSRKSIPFYSASVDLPVRMRSGLKRPTPRPSPTPPPTNATPY